MMEPTRLVEEEDESRELVGVVGVVARVDEIDEMSTFCGTLAMSEGRLPPPS